jgi:hypothetical protein
MIRTPMQDSCVLRQNRLRIERDHAAMKKALQCLHTLSYSDACEILERRLNEIRGNDENNGD